jgi:hypothetical protein
MNIVFCVLATRTPARSGSEAHNNICTLYLGNSVLLRQLETLNLYSLIRTIRQIKSPDILNVEGSNRQANLARTCAVHRVLKGTFLLSIQ